MVDEAAAGDHPPRVPFVLSVGVTGHRSEALGANGGDVGALRERVMVALRLVTQAALETHAAASAWFLPDKPRLYFVSALADGADQMAAECALELGYELHAIFPFEGNAYRAGLAGSSLERFDALLAKAHCVLELPGDEADPLDGYVMTGRATVAHCTMLLAIWDGLKPRGRGGTGEVVELAIARGTPVIHVPTAPDRAERLIWAAFDPVVDTLGDDPMAERPLDQVHIDQVLRASLLPPPDAQEHRFYARFARERKRRFRVRIEYALLLAAAGVVRFDPRKLRLATGDAWVADDWREFRAACSRGGEVSASLDQLEHAFAWADRLATHFAHTYRSGHVFNFVLGGIAVCLGLSGFMAPGQKFGLAAFEFLITVAILVNTVFGVRGEWHRRWLDYRQLAERLRPMRSLKMLGIAAPDPPGTRTYPVPVRWIDWYAMAAWQMMGCPAGKITPDRARQLALAVADREISPQVSYNERSAQQMRLLDSRLDLIGTLLFMATVVVSIVTVIGLAIGGTYVDALSDWFTLVSAGFPALGTAIFGIRYQGDFGGTANRSQKTSVLLKAIDDELRKQPSLSRSADLTEQAGRVMLGDLDEFSLVHERHDLSV